MSQLQFLTNKVQQDAYNIYTDNESANHPIKNLFKGSRQLYFENDTATTQTIIDLELTEAKKAASNYLLVDGVNHLLARTSGRIDLKLKGSNLPFIANPFSKAGNYKLYLDSETNVTIDAQRRVSAWGDRLGLVLDFTQATPSLRPLLSRKDDKENLVLQSKNADNASWVKQLTSVSGNVITATAGDGVHRISQDAAAPFFGASGGVAGRTYVQEWDVEYINHDYVWLGFQGSTVWHGCLFRFTTGTVISTANLAATPVVVPVSSTRFRLLLTHTRVTTGASNPFLVLSSSTGVSGSSGSFTALGTEQIRFHESAIYEQGKVKLEVETTNFSQYAGVNGKPALVFNGTQVLITTTPLSSIFSSIASKVYAYLQAFSLASLANITGETSNIRHCLYTNTNSFRFYDNDGANKFATSPTAAAGTLYGVRGVKGGGSIVCGIDSGAGYADGIPTTSVGATTSMTNTMRIGSSVNGFHGKLLSLVIDNDETTDPEYESEARNYYLNSGTVLHEKDDIQSSDLTGIYQDQYIAKFSLSNEYQYYRFIIDTDEEIKHLLRKVYFGESFDFERSPIYPYMFNHDASLIESFSSTSGVIFRANKGKVRRRYELNYTAISDTLRNYFLNNIYKTNFNSPIYLYTDDDFPHQLLEEDLLAVWLRAEFGSGAWEDRNTLALEAIEDTLG